MSSHSACKKSNNTDTLNTQKLEGRGNSRAVFEGGRGITYLCCSHRWTHSASLGQEFRQTRCRFLRRTQRRTRCMFLRRQRRHDGDHGVTTGKSLSSKKSSNAQSNCCHKTVHDSKFTNPSAQPQISVAVLLKLGIGGSNTATRTDQIIYYYTVTEQQPKIILHKRQLQDHMVAGELQHYTAGNRRSKVRRSVSYPKRRCTARWWRWPGSRFQPRTIQLIAANSNPGRDGFFV